MRRAKKYIIIQYVSAQSVKAALTAKKETIAVIPVGRISPTELASVIGQEIEARPEVYYDGMEPEEIGFQVPPIRHRNKPSR